MPEAPDYEQYLPVEDRDDHFVNVAMPRSALRALERDARAHRQTQAAARDVDTSLWPGEAEFQQERRSLAAGAPPDQVPDRDPYDFAREVYDKELADGREWKVAFGTAFQAIVQAAHRGDRRVIIPNGTTAAIGGGPVGTPPPGAGI